MRRFALSIPTLTVLFAVALLAMACGDVNALPGKPPPITKDGGAPGGATAAMPMPRAASTDGASGEAAPAAEPDSGGEDPLVAKGKSVYGSVCIACHNMDPSLPGAIGPDVAGASLDLLKTKVLKNEYPAGYAPKRDTLTMVPLPHLEPDLPAVAAYLASVKGS